MRIIDFLSDSPKTFIFKKSSNKTTFGGFLTLIYGLIVLIMSILFYIDYHINDKYIISYSHFQKKMDVDEINERKTDKIIIIIQILLFYLMSTIIAEFH